MLKKLVVIPVLCLVLTILPGCSQLNGITGKNAAGNLSPTTLTFYIPGEEKTDTKEVLNEVAKKSGLNIKLVFKFINGPYANVLRSNFDLNEKFDAFFVGVPQSYEIYANPPLFPNMARDGSLADITDLLPEYAPDLFSKYDSAELDAARVDGKLYVVPSLYPSWEGISADVNIDMVKKNNIKPINTLEDYGEFLKIIKEKVPGIIPGRIDLIQQKLFTTAYGYIMLDEAVRLVYKWNDPQMKIRPWEQTDEFKTVMRMISDWKQKDLLSKSIYGSDAKTASVLRFGATLEEGPIDDGMYRFNLYNDMKIRRSPPVGNYLSKGAIGINAKSGNIDKVLMFLNWVQSSQENYDLFMYGIEGKHYTLKEGRLCYAPGLEQNTGSYFYWFNLPFRNINYVRGVEQGDSSEVIRIKYKDFIDSRTAYSPDTGFYPDYRAIMSLVSKRTLRYDETISNPLRDDKFNPEYIDQIVKELKDMGTDTVVDEYQQQLDKWRANR